MRFQSLAAFAFLFVLTPVSQSQGPLDPRPVCSSLAGALVGDCHEAINHIDTTWPRSCGNPATYFIVAQVRTCLITTFEPVAANCLEGNKVIAGARNIISACSMGEESQVAGRVSFAGTNDKTGVRIAAPL